MSDKTQSDENAAEELKQTCPRRMGMPGPWKQEFDQDHWRVDWWTELGKKDAERMISGELDANCGGARWNPDEKQPLVCSFCGGISYDDLIRMIEGGWEIDKCEGHGVILYRDSE